MVVYGRDRIDEISLSSPTAVCEFKDGQKKIYVIAPEDFGLKRCEKSELAGGSPKDNADITRAVLNGDMGAKRDAVLMNAGAALYIAGKAPDMHEGIKLAAGIIDSGKAILTLEKFIQASNQP